MNNTSAIHWGIVGTGAMAKAFAADLQFAPGAVLHAVCSRSAFSAESTAQALGAATYYSDLDAFLADPKLDIVYIASPNHCHAPHTLRALEAGKAVLCEKPFALNMDEATAMVDLARAKDLFLMEALWTRFLPSFLALEEQLRNNALGTVNLLRADFGFRANEDPTSRLFDPAQGGGALYDIGVYPLFLAQHLLGIPLEVEAQSIPCSTGVDGTTTINLRHPGGALSQLACSITSPLPTRAHVFGSQGELRLHRMFHMPARLTLHQGDLEREYPLPQPLGKGYEYQAMAAMDSLRQGRTECPLWTLEQTLNLVRLVERVKTAICKFPTQSL